MHTKGCFFPLVLLLSLRLIFVVTDFKATSSQSIVRGFFSNFRKSLIIMSKIEPICQCTGNVQFRTIPVLRAMDSWMDTKTRAWYMISHVMMNAVWWWATIGHILCLMSDIIFCRSFLMFPISSDLISLIRLDFYIWPSWKVREKN